MQGESSGPLLPSPSSIRRVAILCHMHADPDTYLSAYALRALMRRYAPAASVAIVIPEGMSVLTQRFAETFKRGETENPSDEEEFDLMIAVDIGHTELLRGWNERLRRSGGTKILIDHHPIQEGAPYDRLMVDTKASSAAELVYRLFGEAGVDPDQDTAQALLTAILFDSQNLSIAGEGALRTVLELLSKGASLETARSNLRSPPDYGEVVAKFKAAKRVRIFRSGPWVIAVSTVGSFQANVARSFVSMGADLAIVAGESGDETRASLRSSHRFYSETNIHLGTDIAAILSKDGGYGGGHPTAASLTCKVEEEKLISDFLALAARLLRESLTEIK